MKFFWSDLHLNHANVMKYCNRQYSDVVAMNEDLVARWNKVIGLHDEAYFLGDFAIGDKPTKITNIFNALNGHKHLILGNHDEKNPITAKLPWVTISHIKIVKQDGHKAVLCHYPMETWPSSHHGALHFHGHSHGSLKRIIPHRFDVGCDVYQYPVSFEEMVAKAAAQEFAATDHHGDI